MSLLLARKFVPKPKDGYRAYDTEHKILKVSCSCEIDIKKRADKRPDIAAYYADEEVHATSFALPAHDTVGYIADDYTCEYRPSSELRKMIEHINFCVLIEVIQNL